MAHCDQHTHTHARACICTWASKSAHMHIHMHNTWAHFVCFERDAIKNRIKGTLPKETNKRGPDSDWTGVSGKHITSISIQIREASHVQVSAVTLWCVCDTAHVTLREWGGQCTDWWGVGGLKVRSTDLNIDLNRIGFFQWVLSTSWWWDGSILQIELKNLLATQFIFWGHQITLRLF